jgi:RimJ/RimL family protein N-acetyltransferase
MSETALQLPRTIKTRDGGEATLRLLASSDRDAMRAFTGVLSEHDLLFLRRDITDDTVLDDWIGEVERGRTITVVAESGGRILGYASLSLAIANWSQHVGEIRVLVGKDARGKGIGRVLTEAVFAQALDKGIEKIVAQMTIDQKGAIATFEELGFKAEALLRDHVKDRAGQKHDLLVYSHDVQNFQSQLDAYGVSEAAGAS